MTEPLTLNKTKHHPMTKLKEHIETIFAVAGCLIIVFMLLAIVYISILIIQQTFMFYPFH
jgi:hypothetical protein